MHLLGLLALPAMIVWLHDAFVVAALLEVGCELGRQLLVGGHRHPSFRCFEQPNPQDAVEPVWIHFRFRSVERAILLAPNEGRSGTRLGDCNGHSVLASSAARARPGMRRRSNVVGFLATAPTTH